VSVIVTARNEELTVGRCLDALIKQDYPDYEVLFVDAASQDNTRLIAEELASEHSRLKVVQLSGNASQCRNKAIQMSKSDVIAFTDADVEVPSNWLSTLVNALHSRPEAGGVGGPNSPLHTRNGGITKAVDLMLTTSLGSMRSAQSYDFKERKEVKSIPCCNAAYPRRVLQEIGGFDEDLVGCDDTDLGYRIRDTGRKLLFEPRANVIHSVKFNTLRQFSGWVFKYGRGRGYACRRKRYLFSGPALPAAAILAGVPLLLLAMGVLRSFTPLTALFSLYLAGLIAYSVGVAVTKREFRVTIIGPVVLAIEHVSYFLGFLVGILDARPSPWSN